MTTSDDTRAPERIELPGGWEGGVTLRRSGNHAAPAKRQASKEIIMNDEAQGRPVLVTTEFRGVFFGYATDTSGENVTLTGARNCIYWPSNQGGFAGLAAEGPVKGSRIGAKVSRMDLRKVTSVTEMTAQAVTAWEAADVYRG